MKQLTKVDFIVKSEVVKEADLASLYPPKPKAVKFGDMCTLPIALRGQAGQYRHGLWVAA